MFLAARKGACDKKLILHNLLELRVLQVHRPRTLRLAQDMLSYNSVISRDPSSASELQVTVAKEYSRSLPAMPGISEAMRPGFGTELGECVVVEQGGSNSALFHFYGQDLLVLFSLRGHGETQRDQRFSVHLTVLRGREKKCSAGFQPARVLLTQKELSRLRCRRDAGATTFLSRPVSAW